MSAAVAIDPLRRATLQHLQKVVADIGAHGDVTPRELVGLMEQVANSALAVQAMAMAAIFEDAEAATAPVSSTGDLLPDPEFIPDEMALTLRCSSVTAHRRCQVAKDAARHPALVTHWAAGVLSSAAVAVITELVGCLDASALSTYDLVVDAADYAACHTPNQTRAWLTRRVLAADPQAAEERRRRAFAERRVTFTPGNDSMASLWALLPAVQARQVYDTVDAVAMAADADSRTMDQRRADALVDLVVGRAEPPRVQVQVLLPATGSTDGASGPVEVAGLGPVLPSEVRHLLDGSSGDPRFRVLRTDPDSGGLVSVDERQYRPSTRLRRAVEARDVVCRFPGCRRSASGRGTDLDHTVPWPAGSTDATNLAVLCRRHHRLKHSPGWRVQLDPDGVMTWTTPVGRTFRTTPWTYVDPRAP